MLALLAARRRYAPARRPSAGSRLGSLRSGSELRASSSAQRAALRAACCLLALATLAVPARAADRVDQAVVPVLVANLMGNHYGSAFAIGDGSWVVTCHHVVAYPLAEGKQYIQRYVTIASPWTGEAETARVAATDAAADLALLKLQTRGLPALPLAPREEIENLRSDPERKSLRLALAGYPPPLRLPGPDEPIAVKHDESELMAVGAAEGVPMFILRPCPNAGPGWSGGPLYLPESGAVVGVFHALISRKSEPDISFPRAVSVARLYALLEQAGVKDFAPFLNPPAPAASPDDRSAVVFRHEMRASLAAMHVQWQIAEEERRAQLKLRPGSARAQAALAGALFAQNKREESLAAFAESARLDPGRARTFAAWGAALEQGGQLKEAEERFRRAVELAPDDADLQISLAGLLQRQRRFEDARAPLAKALEAAPLHPLARGLHGANLVDTGKPEEGIAALREAVALSAQTPYARSIRLSLVDALKKSKRWDEAETELREMLAGTGDDALGHYYLATLLNERGKREAARQEAQRCLDLKPEERVAAAARSLLDRLAP
jgi:tetratricopeptide (TPR) repeat protein